MSAVVKCERLYDKKALKNMIESCGCCPPMEPQCPPLYTTSCPPDPICCNTCPPQMICKSEGKSNCPPPMPITCMPCVPQPALLPRPPRPFVCPPCTGHPCITCAPLPKPVPAPFEVGPVFRAPITTGGLFYIGTVRCYPCTPFTC